MKKESLYLNTSVPSAYYDARAKERMETTIKFWKEVLPQYATYVSEITLRELNDTKDDDLREKFMHLIMTFLIWFPGIMCIWSR